MSFDSETADAFLAAYREIVGSASGWHPYWDLRVAVDFLPDIPRIALAEAPLARLEDFVEGALAALG